MKQKRLVMLVMCVFALVLTLKPLTVKAGSSKDYEDDIPLPFDDQFDLEEIREGVSELGFKDGLFWVTMIHDGEDINDVNVHAQIGKAKLEPGKFYTVEIAMIALWDEAECKRNAQTYLQARFPQTVFANSPNAFGAAAFGEHVNCVAETVPVTSSSDLRIHYVQDSAVMLSLAVDGLVEIGSESLLESESGLCIAPMLDRGGMKDMPLIVGFITYTIYTEPLHGDVGSNENQMNIWELQKLNGESYTPAPASKISVVDYDGNIIKESGDQDKTAAIGLIISIIILACIAAATVMIIVDRHIKWDARDVILRIFTNIDK